MKMSRVITIDGLPTRISRRPRTIPAVMATSCRDTEDQRSNRALLWSSMTLSDTAVSVLTADRPQRSCNSSFRHWSGAISRFWTPATSRHCRRVICRNAGLDPMTNSVSTSYSTHGSDELPHRAALVGVGLDLEHDE